MRSIKRLGFFAAITVIVCAMAVTSACNLYVKQETTTIADTKITDTTDTATPSPTPTSKPTLIPTPIPIPTPVTVFVPRETLPDGQLFEAGYFAVLPAEGAVYSVFDCFGQQIDSFRFTDGESNVPIGLFTEKELAVYDRINQKNVKTILTQNADGYTNALHSFENGFYQVDYENRKVILYNAQGVLVQTIISPLTGGDNWADIVVTCFDDETVVSFSSNTWTETSSSYSIAIYFASSYGTIQNTFIAQNLPSKPLGLVGRQYLLLDLRDEGDWSGEHCTLIDFSGAVIMEDVFIETTTPYTLWSQEGETYVRVSDYFLKDGITYDSSLQPVAKNTLDAEGDLIYGVEYDVGGIVCTATRDNQGSSYYNYAERPERVAVGTKDNQMAIKTKNVECVFDCYGASFYGMNDQVVLLQNKSSEILLVSIATGKVIQTIEHARFVQIADMYVLVYLRSDPTTGQPTDGYIVDKDGNIRYQMHDLQVETTSGEYIILHRGPYVGIADLNGDWYIKALTKEMSMDTVLIYS